MLPRPKNFSLRRGEFHQHQQPFASCCNSEGCAWLSSSRPVKAQTRKRDLHPSGLHTEGFSALWFPGREVRNWASGTEKLDFLISCPRRECAVSYGRLSGIKMPWVNITGPMVESLWYCVGACLCVHNLYAAEAPELFFFPMKVEIHPQLQ